MVQQLEGDACLSDCLFAFEWFLFGFVSFVEQKLMQIYYL